jgi:hypothetical protein
MISVCAGADTIEELYELFEALICCCKSAGIQVKASKVHVSQLHHHTRRNAAEGCQSLPHQEYDLSLSLMFRRSKFS